MLISIVVGNGMCVCLLLANCPREFLVSTTFVVRMWCLPKRIFILVATLVFCLIYGIALAMSLPLFAHH